MVFGKFVTAKEDMEIVRRICDEVFVRELGLDISAGNTDAFCTNALVYAGEEPAGMGRILFDGERFKIAEIAVLPAYRGQGYGDFLVRLLVDKAMMANAQLVRLDALEGTQEFFRKIGFEPEGALFEGCGGKWQPMLLRPGQIHTCCQCRR